VTFTAALPSPARYPVLLHIEREREKVAMRERAFHGLYLRHGVQDALYLLRLPFMTGQVVLDFDQSRFRLTPSFFFI
jgi:hypothetical protein